MPRVRAAGPLLSTIDHWVNLPTMRQFVYMRDDSTVRATVRAQAATARRRSRCGTSTPGQRRCGARARCSWRRADEARKVGLPLIVHATELATARDASPPAPRCSCTAWRDRPVDDAFVAALKRAGTIVIPTLTVREGYADVFLGRSPASR
jgi:hypothetical protein